jgi:hypothetical protein
MKNPGAGQGHSVTWIAAGGTIAAFRGNLSELDFRGTAIYF